MRVSQLFSVMFMLFTLSTNPMLRQMSAVGAKSRMFAVVPCARFSKKEPIIIEGGNFFEVRSGKRESFSCVRLKISEKLESDKKEEEHGDFKDGRHFLNAYCAALEYIKEIEQRLEEIENTEKRCIILLKENNELKNYAQLRKKHAVIDLIRKSKYLDQYVSDVIKGNKEEK
ncbi:MAG TPA: hypothetical protein PLU71_01550 [Candidatus Dependentiae bacterium]|nr:hypothetical protein [Candidatus Dependentiae bacterium]HRQ62517.1 hypothetical protein [Candidatus Dependentiae bacterium]